MNTDNIYVIDMGKNLFVINLNTLKHITILKDKINEIKIIYPDLFEGGSYLDDFTPIELKKTISPLIIPNFNCNYSCEYCFEKNLDMKLGRMSVQDIYLIDNFYKRYCEEEQFPYNFSEIKIMGGEALIPDNMDILNTIASTWSGSLLKITTNGSYLNDYLDFSKNNHVEFKVSLDGIKEIHHKYRHCQQTDVYEKTIQGIKNMLKENIRVTILTVFDPEYAETYPKFFDLLESIGWRISPELNVAFISKIGIGADDISFDYIMNSLEAYKKLKDIDIRTRDVDARKLLPGGINLVNAVHNGENHKYIPYRCSCLAKPDFTFLPDGTVHLCMGIPNNQGYIGRYKPNIEIDFEKIALFKKRRIDNENMQKCKKCSKKVLCMSECIATSFARGKEIFGVSCELWENTSFLNYFETVFC